MKEYRKNFRARPGEIPPRPPWCGGARPGTAVASLSGDTRDGAPRAAGGGHGRGLGAAHSATRSHIMPNVSQDSGKGKGSTNSGHGALGMGGQPAEDPRGSESGREDLPAEDLGGGTGPVAGAFGSSHGGAAGSDVAGVIGDRDVTDPITRAARAARETGEGGRPRPGHDAGQGQG
jgi:hypothetical protein